MSNSRSHRRNSQSRERESYSRYSDPRSVRQSMNTYSDSYPEDRSFRSRDEQENDSQERYFDYPNGYRSQGRFENEDSGREYRYSQYPSGYSRGPVRTEFGYPTDYSERNYSNSFSGGNPHFEYIEQERNPRGRYFRQMETSQNFRNRNDDQYGNSSDRFTSLYENRSIPRYEEFEYERIPGRNFEGHYSY